MKGYRFWSLIVLFIVLGHIYPEAEMLTKATIDSGFGWIVVAFIVADLIEIFQGD